MSQEQTKVEGQQDAGKVEKRYKANMKKLAAVFSDSGKGPIGKRIKVANSDVASIVEELLKERVIDVKAKFKIQCIGLLDKKLQFDREIKEEEQKLIKIKETKMEEFSKAIEETFALVESIDKLAQDFAATLGGEDPNPLETAANS